MIKTFKYRLVPTRKQQAALQHTLDSCRFLYNCALEQRKMQHIGQFAQMRQVTEVRAEFPEYKETHVHVLQNVVKKLDRAFQGFFRRIKSGQKAGFPRFKGKDRFAPPSGVGSINEQRFVIIGNHRMTERMYEALRPIYRLCEKLSGEPTFALTEIVKENGAGRSYLITSHRRGKRRLACFGVTNRGHRVEPLMAQPSCYPELRAKAEEFRKEFSGPIA